MIRTRLVHIALALLICLNGCGFLLSNQPMNQAQIKNFETRSIDSSFDSVYSAATEALFDLGYVIRHSEKASGLIMGEKTQTESVWVPASPGKPAGSVDKQRTYSLTLLIKKEDTKSTNVRIKTSVDGEPKFNKRLVDQVWVYVDRQVMMEAEMPKPTKATHARKGGLK